MRNELLFCSLLNLFNLLQLFFLWTHSMITTKRLLLSYIINLADFRKRYRKIIGDRKDFLEIKINKIIFLLLIYIMLKERRGILSLVGSVLF